MKTKRNLKKASFPMVGTPRCGVRTARRAVPTFKWRHLIQICLLCATLLPAVIQAQTYTDKYGTWYYVTNYDGIVTITGFRGSGDVTVPDNIYGMPVTTLGGMIYGTPSLHSVIIPDTITSIGDDAFYGSGLTSITIPDSVTNIGSAAFYQSGLTSITLPDSATNLGIYMFYDCGLTNATIGNRVGSIPNSMFSGCRLLTSFNIPGSVTSIGSRAFEWCFALTNITIPNGVTTIGDSAFSSCIWLTNITIPTSVTNIGAWTFSYRNGPTSMYFEGNAPASVGASVFDGASVTAFFPGTTGWANFAQLTAVPVVLWNPQAQTGDGCFGVRNNQFGFNIAGTTNIPIVVEAATDLTQPLWTPLFTGIVSNGSVYFEDPQWTNYPGRFYRIRSP